MRQFLTFTKKEILEQLRTGKLFVLVILFLLFGIMNPTIAGLTPQMMEMMSTQLAESGMSITAVEVDAMTSWTQFFKNMPMALIIVLVLFSGILTTEYQKGTLINVITKGMKRWKIFIAKMGVMMVIWTLGCLLTYVITFECNNFLWDNSVAHNISAAAGGFYLLGLWLISVLGMASVFCNSQGVVILTVGAAFGISYLLGLFETVKEYVPTYVMDSANLLAGTKNVGDYLPAVVITIVLIVLESVISVVAFNKKSL